MPFSLLLRFIEAMRPPNGVEPICGNVILIYLFNYAHLDGPYYHRVVQEGAALGLYALEQLIRIGWGSLQNSRIGSSSKRSASDGKLPGRKSLSRNVVNIVLLPLELTFTFPDSIERFT